MDQNTGKKEKEEIGSYYTACYIREGALNQKNTREDDKELQKINVVHPLI